MTKTERELGESCAGCMHARVGFNLIECRFWNRTVGGMEWCAYYDEEHEEVIMDDDYEVI